MAANTSPASPGTGDKGTGAKGAKRPRGRARAALRGEIADVVRRAILVAAENVFARRGFDDAKMTEIGHEAGLATGTLYNYFDSKDQIVAAIITERGGDLLGRLEPMATADEAIGPLLRSLLETMYAHLEQHRALVPVIAQAGGRGQGSFHRAAPVEIFERFFAVFLDCLKRALRRGELARTPGMSIDSRARELTFFLNGAMEGTAHAWLADGQRGDLLSRAAFVVDTFLRGARRST